MWPNPQETPDLVAYPEEILHEKLHFCPVYTMCFPFEVFFFNDCGETFYPIESLLNFINDDQYRDILACKDL